VADSRCVAVVFFDPGEVFAGFDGVDPGRVFGVPLDGLEETFFETLGWLPAKIVFDFGGVNGVAEIVSGSVGNEGDLFFYFVGGLVCEFGDRVADSVDDLEVCSFGVATDVIGFADFAFGHYFEDCFGVVTDEQPVADVCAFAVDGERLSGEAVHRHYGDQFFGELVGAVVVAAVGDFCGETVGVFPCSDEVIAGCF